MNDKEFNKQKARIKKYMDKWHATLGLRWFDVDITYERSYSTDGRAASTVMDRWQYRAFDITYYLPNMADLDDEHFEEIIVHELTHCLTAPFAMNMIGTDDDNEYRRNLIEQTVTIVANAIEWSYQAGKDSVKIKKAKKAIKEKK